MLVLVMVPDGAIVATGDTVMVVRRVCAVPVETAEGVRYPATVLVDTSSAGLGAEYASVLAAVP